MTRFFIPSCVLALALSGLFVLPGAGASDRSDHELARAAVRAGEVLPLPTLLDRLSRTHPGQVLELELEREDERWIYEIRLLQAGGQLMKLEVDAGTGDVLETKQKESHRSAPSSPRPR